MEADDGVPHLAFDFSAGDECGNRVHDDDIDGVGSDEELADLQCLLACVGLGDKEVVDIDADFACPCGVEGVLGVDECRDAALLLRVGEDGEREGRFTG